MLAYNEQRSLNSSWICIESDFLIDKVSNNRNLFSQNSQFSSHFFHLMNKLICIFVDSYPRSIDKHFCISLNLRRGDIHKFLNSFDDELLNEVFRRGANRYKCH